MEDRQMKAGVWFYGLGTALTGLIDIAWRAFDASHQPIDSLGKSLPGQQMLACVAGAWLVAAGLAVLWRRSARIGAAACGIAYLITAALWLPRYFTAVHTYGLRTVVLLGVTFGLAQQLMLVAPAAIVYVSTEPPDFLVQKRVDIAARLMLGLPSIVFGIFHLAALRIFATIVPHWMGFGCFWAAVTGVAFIAAGYAICAGRMDVLAGRLLALMLLLFDALVEFPPVFMRLHDQPTWGAAVYNLPAIGACWIFAEFVAARANLTAARDFPGATADGYRFTAGRMSNEARQG
jgi:uncharacterized membrane protein